MFLYQEEQTITFMCHFQLRMYPFDRQRCSVVFNVPYLTVEFGILTKVFINAEHVRLNC